MTSSSQVKILPYKPGDLFTMVLDVESYPQFLPWCFAARIISKDDEKIIAELVIKFKGLTEKYQSRITTKITEGSYLVEVTAISGPFERLDNRWHISPVGEGSRVEFFIDIKFKSALYDYLIGLVFCKACDKMIDAFEKRAGELYKDLPLIKGD